MNQREKFEKTLKIVWEHFPDFLTLVLFSFTFNSFVGVVLFSLELRFLVILLVLYIVNLPQSYFVIKWGFEIGIDEKVSTRRFVADLTIFNLLIAVMFTFASNLYYNLLN